MKKISKLFFILIALMVIFNNFANARCSNGYCKKPFPLISTNCLGKYLQLEDVIVLDVRSAEVYHTGHIENSINIPFEVPFSAWITMKDDLLLELPSDDELFQTLGNSGINHLSKIVVVTSMPAEGELPYSIANATRVADTLIYAGINNVSILDGGFTKWKAEGKTVVTEVPELNPVNYDGTVKNDMFVSIDYVYKKIGESVIVDARDTEIYLGEIVEDWTDKPGHVPSAVSVPAPSLWNEDGTYKSINELKVLVYPIIGANRHQEIIVYCGVGGYASTVWYVLSEMLGYKNVKFFDGSAQEWARYYDMEM